MLGHSGSTHLSSASSGASKAVASMDNQPQCYIPVLIGKPAAAHRAFCVRHRNVGGTNHNAGAFLVGILSWR